MITISLYKNPALHGRSKYIDIKYHYTRQLANKEIKLEFASQMKKKPFKEMLFNKLRIWNIELEEFELREAKAEFNLYFCFVC